jgi:hypothetical protein
VAPGHANLLKCNGARGGMEVNRYVIVFIHVIKTTKLRTNMVTTIFLLLVVQQCRTLMRDVQRRSKTRFSAPLEHFACGF